MGQMPLGCDGLLLNDERAGYCKLNCKWGKIKPGPAIGKKAARKGKRKTVEKPITVCLTLNCDHYEYIKRQALIRTNQENEFFTANELMREALIKAFPLPSHYDMFGKELKK